MSTPSNLYAEKVFAEHPTGLWALDDKADYISLISEAQRVLSDTTKWDIVDGISITVVPRDVEANSSDHWPKVIPFILNTFSVLGPPTQFIHNSHTQELLKSNTSHILVS